MTTFVSPVSNLFTKSNDKNLVEIIVIFTKSLTILSLCLILLVFDPNFGSFLINNSTVLTDKIFILQSIVFFVLIFSFSVAYYYINFELYHIFSNKFASSRAKKDLSKDTILPSIYTFLFTELLPTKFNDYTTLTDLVEAHLISWGVPKSTIFEIQNKYLGKNDQNLINITSTIIGSNFGIVLFIVYFNNNSLLVLSIFIFLKLITNYYKKYNLLKNSVNFFSFTFFKAYDMQMIDQDRFKEILNPKKTKDK